MNEHIKELRSNMTDAGNRMWYYLRNRRLGGFKFIREHAIGPYIDIADFVCREKKLVIEVDGGQHLDAKLYDAKRSHYLECCGYRVLRVWNDEVFKNIQGVMELVLQLLENVPNPPPSSPAPLPRERGEPIEAGGRLVVTE